MEIEVQSPAEIDRAARQVLRAAGDQRKLTLSGEIGAGKTTLIQAICRELGVREEVTSPTFALVNEYTYPIPGGGVGLVRHLDLYRLESAEEAFDIGLEEYLFDPHYCLIEWPELIDPYLPEGTIRLRIEVLPDSGRKILFL